jgi:transcriptional regulator with PAS, ATPase and Fis domain
MRRLKTMAQVSIIQTSNMTRNDETAAEVQEVNPKDIASFFNSIADRVVFIDIEKKILWANKAASEAAGMSPEKIKGRRCYQVLSQKRKICDACPLTKAGKCDKLEERIICSDDGKTWLIKSNPVCDDRGCIIALVETAAEINS